MLRVKIDPPKPCSKHDFDPHPGQNVTFLHFWHCFVSSVCLGILRILTQSHPGSHSVLDQKCHSWGHFFRVFAFFL